MPDQFDTESLAVSMAPPDQRREVYMAFMQQHVAQGSGAMLAALVTAESVAVGAFYVARAIKMVSHMSIVEGAANAALATRVRDHARRAWPVVEAELLPLLEKMDAPHTGDPPSPEAAEASRKLHEAATYAREVAKWAPRAIGPLPALMGAEEVIGALSALLVGDGAQERVAREETRLGGAHVAELAAVAVRLNAALQGVTLAPKAVA